MAHDVAQRLDSYRTLRYLVCSYVASGRHVIVERNMWDGDSHRKALRAEIGQRLREKRHERGLSQERAGAGAGIRQGIVSAMERGENLSIDNLLGMSRALDCSLDYLIAGRESASQIAA